MPKKVELDPEVAESIRVDARSGTNWAEVYGYGPACRCGKRVTPWRTAGGGIDSGKCERHPGRKDNEKWDS